MRIIKGSKVEVLRKKEVPPGEWHCAKIISGNGHTYSVMYEEGSTSEALVERVPRKSIRPCLTPMETMEPWAVGDVAEVFDLGAWRIAMISNVFGGDYYLVRLLGCYEEFRVHKSYIRGSGSCEIVKSNKPSSLNCHWMTSEFPQLDTRRKMQAGNNCLAAQDNTCFQESHIVSSRTLKRASPYCSSHIGAYSGKFRAIEKEGERQRVISKSPSPLLEKVDAVAYPRANLVVVLLVIVPNRLSGHILSSPPQDADTLNSDADSFYDCGDEEGRCPLSLKDDVAASTHRLGLHIYRRTLEAIYASGPLSWEQEALLTNLRISLNISNDEHLMEIRNLKSAGNGLHLS
uniref:ENT domain-containing protein n=1 Tax=Fagus sylvatica TaxID=28930 RepID=A0A2N9EE41_FAGSY